LLSGVVGFYKKTFRTIKRLFRQMMYFFLMKSLKRVGRFLVIKNLSIGSVVSGYISQRLMRARRYKKHAK